MHLGGYNWSWGLALGLGVLSAGASADASSGPRSVLVTPVAGSESITDAEREQILVAVRQALRARHHDVSAADPVIGRAVIACQTPECIDQALDAAGVEFAVVPALWKRDDGEQELTLTLIQRKERNLNADSRLDGNLGSVSQALVDELLARREAALPAATEPTPPKRRPNAWLAGPVILIAGGTAAFIAIGVGAATRSDTQQLNTAAVAGWSAFGAAALAGGVAWWVVGAKRRRAPAVSFCPTGIDLRLRF